MFPLEGIKVLDLMTLSGYCGMELADYGAEVIKVEAPGAGDPLRTLAPLKMAPVLIMPSATVARRALRSICSILKGKKFSKSWWQMLTLFWKISCPARWKRSAWDMMNCQQ